MASIVAIDSGVGIADANAKVSGDGANACGVVSPEPARNAAKSSRLPGSAAVAAGAGGVASGAGAGAVSTGGVRLGAGAGVGAVTAGGSGSGRRARAPEPANAPGWRAAPAPPGSAEIIQLRFGASSSLIAGPVTIRSSYPRSRDTSRPGARDR